VLKGKLKNIFLFGALVFLLLTMLSFSGGGNGADYRITPPGCIKVSDNFYCDETEIANIHWREYLYWMAHVFGDTSQELKAALPDTSVWHIDGPHWSASSKYLCLLTNDQIYFRHPAYDFYPVVGVTQQQAIAFAKWRADRVFERLLIEQEVLTENPKQNKEMYFTIERYFAGNYLGIMPSEKMEYYPDYGLPGIDERNMLVKLTDSLTQLKWKAVSFDVQAGIVPCKGDTFLAEPTTTVRNYKYRIKRFSFCNFRGNVSEWSSEPGVTFGGGWLDTKERIMQSDTFHTAGANAWTGFRNVCRWKKWEGSRD
jgi:hypothetical protein